MRLNTLCTPGLPLSGTASASRYQEHNGICSDRHLCWAEPVFRDAGSVGVEAVPYATSGIQRLGVLAPLPRYSNDADTATGTGVSTAHESLWRALSASHTGTV